VWKKVVFQFGMCFCRVVSFSHFWRLLKATVGKIITFEAFLAKLLLLLNRPKPIISEQKVLAPNQILLLYPKMPLNC